MRREMVSALLALALAPNGAVAGIANGSAAGAHVTWSVDSCLSCHSPLEAADVARRTARPCRTLCATCHQFRDRHHPVGVQISRPVPGPLLLTGSGATTCGTCHDVTLPRFENAVWVSQSLVERAARRPQDHRTYLLVMRNDRGQLCRSCH